MRCDSGAGRRKNSLAQVTLVLRQSPTSSEICATRARVFPSVSRCCAVAVAVARSCCAAAAAACWCQEASRQRSWARGFAAMVQCACAWWFALLRLGFVLGRGARARVFRALALISAVLHNRRSGVCVDGWRGALCAWARTCRRRRRAMVVLLVLLVLLVLVLGTSGSARERDRRRRCGRLFRRGRRREVAEVGCRLSEAEQRAQKGGCVVCAADRRRMAIVARAAL